MMRSKRLSFAVVLVAGLVMLWGCPKKSEMSTVSEPSRAETTAETQPPAIEERAAVEPEPVYRPEEPKYSAEAGGEKARPAAEGLKPVYFDFDEAAIRADARAVIEANAAWLRANPKAAITIEGNCDERGTKEYNLALGQRRAANIKKYLAGLGIAQGRISLLSFGKEKPLCTQHTEGCMQKNRRGDFVVAEARVSRQISFMNKTGR
jgi:peptidoglycan-associated lipoprotein